MGDIELNATGPEIADIYPLSPMQQGMLFLALNAPGTGLYVEQVSYTRRGAVDLSAFERAWQYVVARHTVLRTSLLWEDAGEPLQIVEQEVPTPFEYVDWRDMAGGEQRQRLSAFMEADRRRGFDLSRAPLFRLTVFHLNAEEYRVVFTHHHVILDGWSVAVLLGEVLEAYGAFATGTEPRLRSPQPYRDYIEWLCAKDQGAAEVFWRERLAGFHEPTLLGLHRADKGAEGTKRELRVSLSEEVSRSLAELARGSQVTLNTVVQGAWALLLSRYAGQAEVLFGATVSGRPPGLAGVESMVGLFINTLPVRVRVEGGAGLREWLRTLQRAAAEGYGYEWARLSDVQGWAGAGAGRALFDTLVVFENYPAGGAGEGASFAVEGEESWERVNYPAALVASVSGGGLRLRLAYDEEAVGRERGEGVLRQLVRLLRQMGAEPEAHLDDLRLLDEEEQLSILKLGRGAARDYGAAVSVERLVAAQARRRPEASAVADEVRSYSYGELERRAGALAGRLRRLGVGAEGRVGVLLPRGAEAVSEMLGVWKAGAAYVPLDASYPEERLAAIVDDSGLACIISRRDVDAAGRLGRCARVWLDELEPESLDEAGGAFDEGVGVDTLAYVIYTSGSTGRPKGVGVTHRNLYNLVRWQIEEYGVNECDRMTQVASLSFDASVWETWQALAAGACLEVVPERLRGDLFELGRWLAQKEITVTFMPTPVAEQFLNEGVALPDSLRLLGVGGDRLRRRADAGAGYGLVNIYGPTETTVASSCGMVAADGDGLPSIGRPLANTQYYVLDAWGRLCPAGVAGELYIGGAGVARGYVNRPAQTAERFLPDPFTETAGGRLYRTGDVVRWREDGELEFIGRVDQQAKVRGHRIELGEIEAVLAQHPSVRQCAVMVSDMNGTSTLVAYVAGEAAVSDLQAHLSTRLPGYMVPQRFVMLAALPLTPNGKLDRAALPAPHPTPDASAYVAPATPTEEMLCRIWSDVLGAERVGTADDFFDLGGDSILSIQIGARAAEAGLSLTTRDIFEHQTVAALARAVTARQGAEGGDGESGAELPLTPIQEWFFGRGMRRPWHYNQAALLADATPLDGSRLCRAVERVLASHEVFRLRFVREGEGPARAEFVPEWEGVRCGRVEFGGLPGWAASAALSAEAGRVQRSLEPASGRTVAALRAEGVGGEGGGRLLVVAHHLVIDGVSWRLLLDQVERAYAAGGESAGAALAVGSHPAGAYGAWARRLAREARSPETRAELPYWLAQHEAAQRPLPRDHERGRNTVGSAETVWVEFDERQTEALLREAPRRLRAQAEEVLLYGVAEALWGGADGEAAVWCEGHGREPLAGAGAEAGGAVGWLTALYPVRLARQTGAVGAVEALRAVQAQLRAVPRRGLGYGLLRYAVRAESLQGGVGCGVSFNYLGQWDANLGGLFRGAGEGVGAGEWEGEERAALVEVHGSASGGRVRVGWTYGREMYERATVEGLAGRFRAAVEEVIAAATASEERPAAPTEVSDIALNDAEWKALLSTVRS